MHSFEVHSDESVCRKSGRLGMEQVFIYPEVAWKLERWRSTYGGAIQINSWHKLPQNWKYEQWRSACGGTI